MIAGAGGPGRGAAKGVPAGQVELVEVVTPRTNAAAVAPAENFFAAISLSEPFALEIAATRDARWFLVRAGSPAMRAHIEDQLGVAYPQAELRRLDAARFPALDPARCAPDEQVAACSLRLRRPPFLPLRTFSDREAAADLAGHAAQADPLLPVLGALGDLPPGWRALSQLVLRPVADDWCRAYLRLAVEHPLASERARGGAASLLPVYLLVLLLLGGAGAVQGALWYEAGEWVPLVLLGTALVGLLPGLAWLGWRLAHPPVYDPRLVQDKISRVAYQADLRLALFAPAGLDSRAVTARLQRIGAAYRQFNLASGNGLVPHPLRLPPRRAAPPAGGGSLDTLSPPQGRALRRGTADVLNTRELAGLWHLPQALSDVPLLERTTARRRLPLPGDVSRGCPIGVSTHLGRRVPVAVPDDLLRRHLLLVAKTRRGKSSLLTHLARYLMTPHVPGERPPTLVLVDPHRDLAQAVLGLVPPGRRGDVVALDLADSARPFGLNLLDTGLGWSRDKAVGNVLALFRREFDAFWGPRMEDAFRFALLTLYEANEALCQEDPRQGRERQLTVLQVPTVLADAPFRRRLLRQVRDPLIGAWWRSYFDRLDRKFAVEIINPVQTKVSRFAGSAAARAVVGQSRSTIDPAAWVREGAVIVINTARGVVGEDTAALVGGCLINLVGLLIGEQAALPAADRQRVSVIVDEFHTMPGADYEGIVAELAKYGASLVLATQSLSQLETLDPRGGRALRTTLFSNLDGLFAFHTSAEDARYLIPELGEGVDEADLLELGEYRCYAKLSTRGERLPVFSVRLDPPPPGDPALAAALTAESARRYGRDRATVEAGLASLLERVTLTRAAAGDGASPPEAATTTPPQEPLPLKAPPTESTTPSGAAPRPPGAPGARSR
ncbi:MAG TPA: hypothetical protein VH257_12485, partial [Chloroflexota bacterium]|nr:hypothetical protein [Chloroflexota bacterium]